MIKGQHLPLEQLARLGTRPQGGRGEERRTPALRLARTDWTGFFYLSSEMYRSKKTLSLAGKASCPSAPPSLSAQRAMDWMDGYRLKLA